MTFLLVPPVADVEDDDVAPLVDGAVAFVFLLPPPALLDVVVDEAVPAWLSFDVVDVGLAPPVPFAFVYEPVAPLPLGTMSPAEPDFDLLVCAGVFFE